MTGRNRDGRRGEAVRLERARAWSWRVALFCLCLLLAPHLSDAATNHVQKALGLINNGDLAAAEREARLATQDPDSQALGWATLGAIRVQQRKYEEGAGLLRKALRLNSRLVGARVTLAGVYVLQGKKDQAREMFRQALRLDPTNRNARFDLAALESEAGNYQASLDTAQPIATSLRHSSEGLSLLATDYTGLNRKDLVRALVSDWKALPEASPASATDFASLLVKNGLVQEAIEVLEQAKSAGQASYGLDLMLANCYLSTGHLDGASENYEAALALNKDCVLCLRGIARVSGKQGNTEKALAYLIKARAFEPDNPDILFELGRVCLERDLIDDALTALQKAVKLRPDNDSFSYVLASAYIGKKQYPEARALLVALVKRRPDDPQLNYVMGAVSYLEANLDQAENYLRKSIALQPDQIASYDYLGRVAERKNDLDRAAQIFGDLAHNHPDYAPAYEGLGSTLLKQHKYHDAQAALERAVSLDPNSVEVHYQLGMVLGRLGKAEESGKQIALARKLENDRRIQNNQRLHLLVPP